MRLVRGELARAHALLVAAVVMMTSWSLLLAPAQAAPPPQFTDTLVASLASPTAVAFMPDGRMLATTQPGQLRVLVNGVLQPTIALDLKPKMCTNSERGLLGVATDPDPASHAIFLFYTVRGTSTACPTNSDGSVMPSGAPRNRVSRFVLKDDNTVDPASETVLLDGIYSPAGYHNAGDLHVGKDLLLYVSTGDGGCDYRGGVSSPGGSGCGGANDASRDRNILNGKILRVTRTGAVPADNPFQGTGTASCRLAPASSGTTCREIFAVGLRNPFRMAFDPNASGTSFRVNDVGQDVWEEIDQGTRGADYGWNVREGHCQQTGSATDCGTPKPAQYTDPVYDYSHTSGCASITGGAFVPNGIWPAAYTGAYLFSDYVCGTIFSLAGSTRTDFVTGLGGSSAVDLAFGPSGSGQALFYTSYANGGQIHRITYTGTANRTPVAQLSASPSSGTAPLALTLSGAGSSDPDGDALTYLWTFGDGSADTTTTSATVSHSYRAGNWTASLRVRDSRGATSAAVTTPISSGNRAPTVTISTPSEGQQFVVGHTYTLRATATDTEDGTLPSSALSWTIVRRHAEHTHPFLGPIAGNNVSFVTPGPEDLAAAANSDLRVSVTATDSKGVSTTVSRVFTPHRVKVTFATSPVGRTVTVNGQPFTGPSTVTSWHGFGLQVGVPAQPGYAFASWSDGGAASHTYTTPSAPATLTATLTASTGPGVPTGFSARQTGSGAATISWAPPASTGGGTITGYEVARDGVDSAGEGAYRSTVSASTRTFTFTRLVTGSSYNLSVRAITNSTGPAASSPVSITAWAVPGAPTSFTVSQSGPGAATMTWAPPTSTGGPAITGYQVSRDGTDTAGEGPYTNTVSASTRSFTMTRLAVGSTYTLTVKAINAAGTGPGASGPVRIS